MDQWQKTFACAFFGSLAADFMQLRRASEEAKRGLPAVSGQPRFYVVAAVTAVISGGLAVLEEPNSPILAFQIGVTAPLIIESIRRKPPELPPSSED